MMLGRSVTRPSLEYTLRAERRRWLIRIAVGALLGGAVGLATSNPLLTAANFAVLPLLFALLWRPAEPPALLFAAGFQWLQVSMPVFNANRRGVIVGLDSGLWTLESAGWLGLVAIVVLAIGMRVGVGSRSFIDVSTIASEAQSLSPRRLSYAYVLCFVFDLGVIAPASQLVPGLRQPLMVLGGVRWVVIFLLAWAAAKSRRFHAAAGAVLAVELVLGLTGYFSGFKQILFLAIVVIAASKVRLRRVIRPALLLFLVLTIVLAAFWQSIKIDYRLFLSQDQTSQVVAAPFASRIRFLSDRVLSISVDDLTGGVESGLERIGYLQFFGLSMRTVPAVIPYQEGRLWGEAIRHVFQPRVFFPDKPVVNDSDRTNEFTGERVATAEEGASISIGYVGESYIDFGPWFMFVPVFLMGLFWGVAYRRVMRWSRVQLLGLAVTTNLLLELAIQFEASNVKIIGGAVTYLLVYWLVLSIGDRAIWRFLQVSRVRPPTQTKRIARNGIDRHARANTFDSKAGSPPQS